MHRYRQQKEASRRVQANKQFLELALTHSSKSGIEASAPKFESWATNRSPGQRRVLSGSMRWLLALAVLTEALVPPHRPRPPRTRVYKLPQETVDLKFRAKGLLDDVKRNLEEGAEMPDSAEKLRKAYVTDVSGRRPPPSSACVHRAVALRVRLRTTSASMVSRSHRPDAVDAARPAHGARRESIPPRCTTRRRRDAVLRRPAPRDTAARPRRETRLRAKPHLRTQEHNDIYVAFLEFFMDLKLNYDVSYETDKIGPTTNPLTDIDDELTREKLPFLYDVAMTMRDGAKPEVQLGIWRLVVDKLIDRTGMSNKEFSVWASRILAEGGSA